MNNYQNPTMNRDFLGQMKDQINKDMMEIRKQQEMFMERITQLIQRPNQENQQNQVQPAQQMQPQMQPLQYLQAYPQAQAAAHYPM